MGGTSLYCKCTTFVQNHMSHRGRMCSKLQFLEDKWPAWVEQAEAEPQPCILPSVFYNHNRLRPVCASVRAARSFTGKSWVNIGEAVTHWSAEWLDNAPVTGAFGVSKQTLTNTHAPTCLYTTKEGETLKWKETDGGQRCGNWMICYSLTYWTTPHWWLLNYSGSRIINDNVEKLKIKAQKNQEWKFFSWHIIARLLQNFQISSRLLPLEFSVLFLWKWIQGYPQSDSKLLFVIAKILNYFCILSYLMVIPNF